MPLNLSNQFLRILECSKTTDITNGHNIFTIVNAASCWW